MTRCFVSAFKDNSATVNDYVQAKVRERISRGYLRSSYKASVVKPAVMDVTGDS